MRILVLGQGKTGKLVAEVAAERGHGVNVLDALENVSASALTPPFVAGFDVVIDFTTPEAVVQNMRACLATGAKMVVGTTGWYDELADMRGLAERKQAALLYGTNYSVGVQVMLKLAAQMGASLNGGGIQVFRCRDAPCDQAGFAFGDGDHDCGDGEAGRGEEIGVPIEAMREGDAKGTHVLEAESDADR